MNHTANRFLIKAIFGLNFLLLLLSGAPYAFGQAPPSPLPPHLRSRPTEILYGDVARKLGTNLVINLHTNQIVYSAPVTGFQRVNGRVTPVVLRASEPIATNKVTITYTLIGYPNWHQAQEGDKIRVQVVQTTGPGGTRHAYYAGRVVPKNTGRLLE